MAQKTYRDPDTGKIFNAMGSHIASLEDYQSGVTDGTYSSAVNWGSAPWYNSMIKASENNTSGSASDTGDDTSGDTGTDTGTDTGDEETAGSIYDDVIDDETPEQKKEREERERQAEEARLASESVVDEEAIRQKMIKRFQDEIDSLNDIYAEQKRVEAIAGRGRVGSSTAIQARRGLIGSTFGDTQRGKIDTLNKQAQTAIDTEKSYAIGQVQAKIRRAMDDELKRKQTARKTGGKEYLEFLKDQTKRAEARATDAIDNMIAIENESGTEATDEDWEAIADALGMSIDQVKRMYNVKKADAKAAASAADLESREVLKPGETIVNSAGEVIFTAPEKDEVVNPLDYIKEIGGYVFTYDPETGTTTKEKAIKPENNININTLSYSDKKKFEKDPEKYDIIDGKIVEIPPQPTEEEMMEMNRKISDIDNLLTHKGLGSSVGTIPGLGRFSWNEWFTGNKESFLGYAKKLIDTSTLDKLIEAKKAGATFGALSDTELQMLKDSALVISNWFKDGKLQMDGFNVSEKEFKKVLGDMKKVAEGHKKLIEERQVEYDEHQKLKDGSGSSGDLKSYLEQNPEAQATYLQIAEDNPNLSDEDIYLIIATNDDGGEEPFSKVGSDTNIATNWLDNYGVITGYGSKYWKHGLDIDVKIGDPIYSPVSGTVVQASDKGDGFGMRVGIRTAKGNIVYLAHNDSVNVKVGDRISSNQLIAKGGNTGKTYSPGGGDGSHIDLTVQKPDGSYYTPQQIKSLLA